MRNVLSEWLRRLRNFWAEQKREVEIERRVDLKLYWWNYLTEYLISKGDKSRMERMGRAFLKLKTETLRELEHPHNNKRSIELIESLAQKCGEWSDQLMSASGITA